MEIGSEYAWPDRKPDNKEIESLKEIFTYNDRKFVFSGRTAIEYVLKDIGVEKVKQAMLPSYCCQSVIDPFIDLGIQVCFYSVNFINGSLDIQIEIPRDVDILLWSNYFGFFHDFPEKLVLDFQRRGGIVIEDITQSFLSKSPVHAMSNYYIASLRKWGPMLCGGVAYKKEGEFHKCSLEIPDAWFLQMKEKAMRKKRDYLLGEEKELEKSLFLDMFQQTNEYFDNSYSLKGIDEKSGQMISLWYTEESFHRRRENAEIIYETLQSMEKIRFVFPKNRMDCPLFVPVVMEPVIRDRIKKRLIEKKIYCPQHWPVPITDGADSNLYSMELSLICDQRYGKDRIKNMMEAVKEEIRIVELTEFNRGVPQ